MPPPPQGTVGPQGRPLRFLTRAELGQAFADACRVVRAETGRRRGGGTLAWARHPAVEPVLTEFRLRLYEELELVESWDRLQSLL